MNIENQVVDLKKELLDKENAILELSKFYNVRCYDLFIF